MRQKRLLLLFQERFESGGLQILPRAVSCGEEEPAARMGPLGTSHTLHLHGNRFAGRVLQPYYRYLIFFNFSLLPVPVPINFGLSSFFLKITVHGHPLLRPFRFYSNFQSCWNVWSPRWFRTRFTMSVVLKSGFFNFAPFFWIWKFSLIQGLVQN